MEGLALLDLGIFALLVFFTIRGYHQGMITQTIGFVAFVLALILAAKYYQKGTVFIDALLAGSRVIPLEVAHLISFSLIVLSVILTIHLLGYLTRVLSHLFFLTLLDHMGGAVVGLLKGALLVFLLLLIFSELPISFLNSQLERSFLAGDFLSLAPFLKENFFSIFQP